MVSGKLPARFAVHVPPKTGFSDRLVGMVSVFFYALLTDRAIIFWRGPHDGLPDVSLAFEGPNINWTPAEPYKELMGPVPEGHYVHPDSDGPGFRHWNMLGGLHGGIYDRGDLHELGHDIRTVLQTMNRGMSIALLSNPYTASKLYAMGLRPETAFGCALNYLFRPLPGMQSMFKHELAVLSNPATFTIGLQIRTGDASVLDPRHHPVEPATINCFVQCALQIEDHWAVGNLSVAWYVLSDSVHVRKQVRALQGSKVLTRTDMKLEHTASGIDPDVIQGEELTEDGFRAALWEQWLLGMTDVQIVSRQSGFGRAAAFRSLPALTFYTCAGDENMKCGPGDMTSAIAAAADWSSI